MSQQDLLGSGSPAPVEDEFSPEASLPVQADYFSFGEEYTFTFPDGVTFVKHRTLNEGSRRRYLNSVNREVTLERGSGNARMKLASGDEKHLLLEEAITGWNLVRASRQGGLEPVPFDKHRLQDFLSNADPSIIDMIEKDIRKHNKWLLADVTVAGIDEQIRELEELREEKLKEEAGNGTSSDR